jgi:hypothetical protein
MLKSHINLTLCQLTTVKEYSLIGNRNKLSSLLLSRLKYNNSTQNISHSVRLTNEKHLSTFSSICTLQIHHNRARLYASTSSHPDSFGCLRPENKHIASGHHLVSWARLVWYVSIARSYLPLKASISLKLVLNKLFNSVLLPVHSKENNKLDPKTKNVYWNRSQFASHYINNVLNLNRRRNKRENRFS